MRAQGLGFLHDDASYMFRCTTTCIDKRVVMRIDSCKDIFTGMCIDMCVDICMWTYGSPVSRLGVAQVVVMARASERSNLGQIEFLCVDMCRHV